MRTHYITISHGLSGWFAVMIEVENGMHEPLLTGIGRYDTVEEAREEARTWAEAEGLTFKD